MMQVKVSEPRSENLTKNANVVDKKNCVTLCEEEKSAWLMREGI